jgi:hypothetical protein
MQRAFTPETFLDPVRMELRKHYSPAKLQLLLDWYRTPLARRVTAAEVRASSPHNAGHFLAYADQLRRQPPPIHRLQLVKRLDAVVDLSTLQMAMVQSVLRAMAERMNPKLPPAKRLGEQQLQAIVQGVERQRPLLKEMALARLLFVYESVSDVDLGEYVRFWETDAGGWFRTLYYRASLEGVKRAAIVMTDILSQSQARPQR